jgi:hypothetical protein
LHHTEMDVEEALQLESVPELPKRRLTSAQVLYIFGPSRPILTA